MIDLAVFCTDSVKEKVTPPERLAQSVYQFVSTRAHDMVQHMHVLGEYGAQCEHITEFGLRFGMSTFAFITTKPKRVVSYDIQQWGMEKWLWAYADTLGVEWLDPVEDSRTADIEETDLLFIDSQHTYEQLRVELGQQHEKVRKWIICHDTETFAKSETGGPGLQQAIDEFTAAYPWQVERHFELGHGLTVLERVDAKE